MYRLIFAFTLFLALCMYCTNSSFLDRKEIHVISSIEDPIQKEAVRLLVKQYNSGEFADFYSAIDTLEIRNCNLIFTYEDIFRRPYARPLCEFEVVDDSSQVGIFLMESDSVMVNILANIVLDKAKYRLQTRAIDSNGDLLDGDKFYEFRLEIGSAVVIKPLDIDLLRNLLSFE